MLITQFHEMFEDVEGPSQQYTLVHIFFFVLTSLLRFIDIITRNRLHTLGNLGVKKFTKLSFMDTYLTTLKKIHECRNIDNAVINDVVRYVILSKLTFLETIQKNIWFKR